MKITTLLSHANCPTFSLEILPGKGLSATGNLLKYKALLQRKPLFVDIPFHAGRPTNTFSGANPTVFKNRPTTEELCQALISNYELTPLAHLICAGFNPERTETALLNLQKNGVENVLLLRGDIQDENPDLENKQLKFAYQLTAQVQRLNEGQNWQGKKILTKTDFCKGVAGYPEPTFETPDFGLSLQYLKMKVEAGADFILTQVFYDNAKFFAFEKACREAGISVPIIPGISPLVSARMLAKLPDFFRVSVPVALRLEIEKCRTEKQFQELGVEWCISQTRELIENGFSNVHYFSLAPSEFTLQVLKTIF